MDHNIAGFDVLAKVKEGSVGTIWCVAGPGGGLLAIKQLSAEKGADPANRKRFRKEFDVQKGLENMGIEVGGLVNEDDLMDAADALEPNSSAALIVWENVWARKVTQAMRDAGGELLAFERLPHEVVQAAREWALEHANA